MKLYVQAAKELSSYMKARNNINNSKNANRTYFTAMIVNIKFDLMRYETSLALTSKQRSVKEIKNTLYSRERILPHYKN
ncbi:hypothetical protein ABE61_20625 [Lysinibacillus sphaericus]|nr:hypothetical protein [Lysinibacillus sphaericus]MBG9479513.1 hypothetical protein [Lysinibacillus sphaericus]MBG9591838.1 hypothetical protein [Lysinibacillus sphaericus]